MVIQVTRRVCRLSRSQQVQCWDKLHLHYICHCMQCRSFIFIWFPIFPIVVLRGHISPSLCSWSQREETRKTLRQAYRGSLSFYLGFMLISLCLRLFIVSTILWSHRHVLARYRCSFLTDLVWFPASRKQYKLYAQCKL
jgi:hypothetical protein